MISPQRRPFPSAASSKVLGLALLAVITAGLGACNNKQGEYTSEGKAQAVERMNTLKSGTDWQMAQQQFLGGEIDKALKTIDRSLAYNPNVPKSHVLRGRILIEKGRLEEARNEFLEAEKLDANNVEAQYYLGIVHEQFSQPEEALTRYQKAADLDTADPQYVVAAAEMLTQLNRLDEAEAYIAARKQNFEYNAAIKQCLGHIALLRNDPRTAADRFNEALLLAPDDNAILEDIAHSQFSAGNFAEAEFAISKLLEKEANKDRRDLKILRAKCLMSINRPVEARAVLLELTSAPEAGRDVQLWIDLGNAAAVLKDRPNLRKASTRVIALAPDRHEGHTLKGLYNRLEGRSEEALAALNTATRYASGEATPYLLKALVLQDLGRPLEARKTIEEALNLNPGSPRLQAMLSSIDSRLGQSPTGQTTVTGVNENANQP